MFMLLGMPIRATPTRHLGTWAETRAAWFRGLDVSDGVMGVQRGDDVVRFRAGARRYVAFACPDVVDHVLHEGRENHVDSIEYETVLAVFVLALITDDGDSWRAHRAMPPQEQATSSLVTSDGDAARGAAVACD